MTSEKNPKDLDFLDSAGQAIAPLRPIHPAETADSITLESGQHTVVVHRRAQTVDVTNQRVNGILNYVV